MPTLAVRIAAFAISLSAVAAAAEFDWHLPPGFPKPVVPADNPMSDAKVALGRSLFYDKRLSFNGQQACATCHKQELAFTDGRKQASGATGQAHPRSSMSLVNVAYAPALTWANPTLTSLEDQVLGPMMNEEPIELGLHGHERELLDKLRHNSRYRSLFAEAFPQEEDSYSILNVARALAAFERSIVSMRSPYDRYRWGGDQSAISDSAKRGELIFASSERGGCFQCHGGWNFAAIRYEGARNRRGQEEVGPKETMGAFFNTGVSLYPPPNRGVYEFTKRPGDLGKFRAPTLRNIAVTAPYMHDGSVATLEEVLDHYAAGGKYDHANKSQTMRPFTLTDSEKGDLIEFLRSLTDEELLHDPRWSDPAEVSVARSR